MDTTKDKTTTVQTTFRISRSQFRDFLIDLINKLHKEYPPNTTSVYGKLWHSAGIGENSRWRDIIAFVGGNANTNRQQTGPMVMKKLLARLPVINHYYTFQYHTNGTVTASVKQTPSTPSAMATGTQTATRNEEKDGATGTPTAARNDGKDGGDDTSQKSARNLTIDL